MSDPTVIYLQPECCADEGTGRLWCDHDAPVDCEDGVPWTKYVLASRLQRCEALLRQANDCMTECPGPPFPGPEIDAYFAEEKRDAE